MKKIPLISFIVSFTALALTGALAQEPASHRYSTGEGV